MRQMLCVKVASVSVGWDRREGAFSGWREPHLATEGFQRYANTRRKFGPTIRV
jgi:hypothetical protein